MGEKNSETNTSQYAIHSIIIQNIHTDISIKVIMIMEATILCSVHILAKEKTKSKQNFAFSGFHFSK